MSLPGIGKVPPRYTTQIANIISWTFGIVGRLLCIPIPRNIADPSRYIARIINIISWGFGIVGKILRIPRSIPGISRVSAAASIVNIAAAVIILGGIISFVSRMSHVIPWMYALPARVWNILPGFVIVPARMIWKIPVRIFRIAVWFLGIPVLIYNNIPWILSIPGRTVNNLLLIWNLSARIFNSMPRILGLPEWPGDHQEDDWKRWKGNKSLGGLPNTGSSCYMNSAIQFLFAAKPFLYTYTNLLKSGRKTEFNSKLVKLAGEMERGTAAYSTQRDFRIAAANGHPEFSTYTEQDALEYFLHLLLHIQTNFPQTLTDVNLNPCDRMRIELCEQIQRGDRVNFVRREEFVLSCPLVDKYELMPQATMFRTGDVAVSPSAERPSGINQDLPCNSLPTNISGQADENSRPQIREFDETEAECYVDKTDSKVNTDNNTNIVAGTASQDLVMDGGDHGYESLSHQDETRSITLQQNDTSSTNDVMPNITDNSLHSSANDNNTLRVPVDARRDSGDELSDIKNINDSAERQPVTSQDLADEGLLDADKLNDAHIKFESEALLISTDRADGKENPVVGSDSIAVLICDRKSKNGTREQDVSISQEIAPQNGHVMEEPPVDCLVTADTTPQKTLPHVDALPDATVSLNQTSSGVSGPSHQNALDSTHLNMNNKSLFVASGHTEEYVPHILSPAATSESAGNAMNHGNEAQQAQASVEKQETLHQDKHEIAVEIKYSPRLEENLDNASSIPIESENQKDENVPEKQPLDISSEPTGAPMNHTDKVEQTKARVEKPQDMQDQDKCEPVIGSEISDRAEESLDDPSSIPTENKNDVVNSRDNLVNVPDVDHHSDVLPAPTTGSAEGFQQTAADDVNPALSHDNIPSCPSYVGSSSDNSAWFPPHDLGHLNVNLEECIAKFMEREQVLSSGTERVFKESKIASLPEYLVIQLRIFVLDISGQSDKLDVRAKVPDKLDMKQWMCEPRWMNMCQDKIQRPRDTETIYQLKAFVTHYGRSPRTGHYVCHVRRHDQWYRYDDSQVTPVSDPRKEEGYFYLYERVDVQGNSDEKTME